MAYHTHRRALVDTQWVSERLHHPMIRVVEVDIDAATDDVGRLPGAVRWSFWEDLYPLTRHDNVAADVAALLARSGMTRDTDVIVMGDAHNMAAAFAFWLLHLIGHQGVHLVDGGRAKWRAEGRPVSVNSPFITPAEYGVPTFNGSARALRDDIGPAIGNVTYAFVDVRSRAEYEGTLFAPGKAPGPDERAGHLPGAVHIPFDHALSVDGSFKSIDELHMLYASQGVTNDKDVIAYCTVGARASLTWFVLSQLLGYPRVRNYDASWAEWGTLVGVPVAMV